MVCVMRHFIHKSRYKTRIRILPITYYYASWQRFALSKGSYIFLIFPFDSTTFAFSVAINNISANLNHLLKINLKFNICLLVSLYFNPRHVSKVPCYLLPAGREIIKRIPCVCSCVIECVSRFYKGLYITLVVSPWPFQCFL